MCFRPGIIAQNKFRFFRIKVLRQFDPALPIRKRTDYQIPLFRGKSLVKIESAVPSGIFPISAGKQGPAAFAQSQALPVEIQDAVRILLFPFHIDLRIVRIHDEPRLSLRKPAFFVPLHCIGVRAESLDDRWIRCSRFSSGSLL